MRTWRAAGMLASSVLAAAPVYAVNIYTIYIPNGATNQCSNCHINTAGGGARTPFGEDVLTRRVQGGLDWPALYALDSDGDGFTNGEELGDPCGQWETGETPLCTAGITHPGDETSRPLGHTADACAPAPPTECPSGSSSSSGAASSSSSGGSASSGTGGVEPAAGCGGNEAAARGDTARAAMVLLGMWVFRARRRR